MTTEAEHRIEWECAMLIANATGRIKRHGFDVSLSHLATHLDDRIELARKVLLVNHFMPDGADADRWINRRGLCKPLASVLDFGSLVDVLDLYDPVEGMAA